MEILRQKAPEQPGKLYWLYRWSILVMPFFHLQN
jgi:hypothetical protein